MIIDWSITSCDMLMRLTYLPKHFPSSQGSAKQHLLKIWTKSHV